MDPPTRILNVLNELQYDFRGFSIEEFVNRIGGIKGRQIYRIPWDMPAATFGAWLSDEDEPREYIFYRKDVPPVHQIHIQLHELAHFLLGHPTLKINRERIASSLKGQETLPFTEYVLSRSTKKSEYEAEAETLASLIQEQAIRNSRLDQLTRDISSDEKLARFVSDMGMV